MANRVVTTVVVAGLLGAGAVAAKYLLPGALGATTSKRASNQAAVQPKVAYLDAKEMTLRLADMDSEHYIKLDPVLAVRAAEIDSITDRLPIVRDHVVDAATNYDSTTLAAAAGKAKLRRQILDALSKDFHDDVVDIYFSEYLVE